MKGLPSIPSARELGVAFDLLQAAVPGSGEVDPNQLALYSQWARFDPRLAEVWVEHIRSHWQKINPVLLNGEIAMLPWPASMGVLLEATAVWAKLQDRRLFGRWRGCVMSGIQPEKSHSQYFIGQRAFAGKLMAEDAHFSLTPYLIWGFLGNAVLVNKGRIGGKTLIPAERRRAVLDELIRGNSRLTAAEYREALRGWVGLRQAEIDLQEHPRLTAVGNTKARYYRSRHRNRLRRPPPR